MKLGVFYEHQCPQPWADGAERKLLHESLDQVELGDRLAQRRCQSRPRRARFKRSAAGRRA